MHVGSIAVGQGGSNSVNGATGFGGSGARGGGALGGSSAILFGGDAVGQESRSNGHGATGFGGISAGGGTGLNFNRFAADVALAAEFHRAEENEARIRHLEAELRFLQA